MSTPAERYYVYRSINGETNTTRCLEYAFIDEYDLYGIDGGCVPEGLNIHPESGLTEQQTEFCMKYGKGRSDEELFDLIRTRRHIYTGYSVGSIEGLLELEFTKMLEADVKFRKCQRCGKYFILKGNYDTRYCERIADGETQTCQKLAAIENYRAKNADNQAISIYQKYYKRYAARVTANQIKREDFDVWRDAAMAKRDDCTEGRITPEEYINWMEAYFPNRRRGKPKKSE